MLVSVIVCTYNGGKRILQTLQSLENMSVPSGIEWELIVVDNNSKDNTKEIVHDFAETSKLNIRYSFELEQGLSRARNNGIKQAKGELVAFTDDDCIPDKYWLTAILNEFASDPDLSLLGGRVELYNKLDKPVGLRSFKDRTLFSSIDQLFILISGCNMIYRKEVINAVGLFDTDLGAGSKCFAADDSDYIYRTYRRDYKIAYSPDVLIYHNHERNSEAEVRHVNRRYVIGRGAFCCKYILRGQWDVLGMVCREYLSYMQGILIKILQGKSFENEIKYSYYLLIGATYRIGRKTRHDSTRLKG